MKLIILNITLLGLLGSVGFALPTKNPEYSMGNELMKQVFSSIRKDRFNLYFNFDVTVDTLTNSGPQIDAFEMQAMMLFKNNPAGIVVSVDAPSPKDLGQEQQLAIRTHLDLSDKYGVIHIHKGEHENEFIGSMLFYTKNPTTGTLVPSFIKLELNDELLDIKRLNLFGAKIKILLPGPKSTKKELKRGLVNALLECDAESDTLDMVKGRVSLEPLEKCSFNFDGELLRVQFREHKPTFLH